MIADLKPYPAYKESGVPWLGAVPEHWGSTKVKNLARSGYKTFVDGDWIESPFITREGIRLIQTGNIGIGAYREKGFRYISEQTFDAFRCTEFQKNDVLICRLGEPVGRACLAPDLGVRMITSVDVCILKLRQDVISDFIVYVMSSPQYLNWVNSLVRGSTRDRVSRSMLGSFVVPLPPLTEQAAIVRFLDHADRKIRRYIRAKQKLIKLLEEQVAACASEAMRHSDCTNERLERVATERIRPIERENAEVYVALGLYNRGRGIFHKRPTLGAELGDSTFSWVKPGDLVISGQFAWEGAVALASSAEDQTIISHRYYTLKGITERLTTPYLWALLRSDFGAMLLDQHSRGAAGRNRPLNLRTLLKESIPVPPYEMQLAVDEVMDATAPLRAQAARAISLLREFRTRLIADVVTGKLDVREAAARLPVEAEEPEEADEIEELTEEQAEAGELEAEDATV